MAMIGIASNCGQAVNLQQECIEQDSPLRCQKSPQENKRNTPITNFFKPSPKDTKSAEKPKDLFGYFRKLDKTPNGSEKLSDKTHLQDEEIHRLVPSCLSYNLKAKDKGKRETRKAKKKLPDTNSSELHDVALRSIEDSEEIVQNGVGLRKSNTVSMCSGSDTIVMVQLQNQLEIDVNNMDRKRKMQDTLDCSMEEFAVLQPVAKSAKLEYSSDNRKRKSKKKKKVIPDGDVYHGKSKHRGGKKRNDINILNNSDVDTETLQLEITAFEKIVAADSIKNSDDDLDDYIYDDDDDDGGGNDDDDDEQSMASTCTLSKEGDETEVVSYEQFLSDTIEMSKSQEESNSSDQEDCTTAKECIKICGKIITTKAIVHGPPSPACSTERPASPDVTFIDSPASIKHQRRRKSNVVIDMNESDLSVVVLGGSEGSKPENKKPLHSFFTKTQLRKTSSSEVSHSVKDKSAKEPGDVPRREKLSQSEKDLDVVCVSPEIVEENRCGKIVYCVKSENDDTNIDIAARKRFQGQVMKGTITDPDTINTSKTLNEKTELVSVSIKKRSRGRPCKLVSENDNNLNRAKDVTKRNKMVTRTNHKEIQDPCNKVGSRKRGRPRSSKSSDSDFETEKISKRSKRSIYKSTVLDVGYKRGSPLRIRLTRLKKSSSGSSPDSAKKPTTRKTSAILKAAKAQEILQKAKTTKHKKVKPASKPKIISKSLKKLPAKSKKAVNKNTKVIKIEDSPEESNKRTPVRNINSVLGKKSKGEEKTGVDNGNIAPFFSMFGVKKNTETVNTKQITPIKKPLVIIDESSQEFSWDDEAFLLRRNMLLSRMAETSRKQTGEDLKAAPLPQVSHVQQRDAARNSLWNLSHPNFNFTLREDFLNKICRVTISAKELKLGSFTSALDRMEISKALIKSCEKTDLSYVVRKQLLQEIGQNNPGFPVNRWFKRYLEKYKGLDSDKSNPASNSNENSSGKVKSRNTAHVEGGKGSRKKKRESLGESCNKRERRSSRRLQEKVKESDVGEIKCESDEVQLINPEKNELVTDKCCDRLWTDKYQPCQSSEIIGNKDNVKKIFSWLGEWKARSDRETRKLKKQLKKEAKKKKAKTEDIKSDEWWFDDDSSDFASDDSDYIDEDDTICNTMLIAGPSGIGKTSAVYACAMELGFKVFEVNASSKRGGKHILSELKEATQSHQVSKGSGSGALSQFLSAEEKTTQQKKKKQIHSAFSSFVKKPEETNNKVANKKKRNSKINEKKKNRKASPKDTISDSNVAKMKIASTSLILIEEVDVIFDDDKGFWSAINTLIGTTKRPIIMTANDTISASQLEGEYERLVFRSPTVASITTHLQLLCLAENFRTNHYDLEKVVKFHNCDIRRSILSLQFWIESGGSADMITSCYDDEDDENEGESFEERFLRKLIDVEIKTIVVSEYYKSQGINEQMESEDNQEGDYYELPSENTLCYESTLGLQNIAGRSGGLHHNIKDHNASLSMKVNMVSSMKEHVQCDNYNNHTFVYEYCHSNLSDSKKNIQESLNSWSEYMDSMSQADNMRIAESTVINRYDNCAWWGARTMPGLSDRPVKSEDNDYNFKATMRDIDSCISVLSMDRFRKEQMRLGHHRSRTDGKQEPPCSIAMESGTNYDASPKDCNYKTCCMLPLAVQCNHYGVTMDYLPTFRAICRSEQYRQATNSKRRFLHYLDQAALSLPQSTLNTFTKAFTDHTT
ncbi:uncharacterized protein LOC100369304 [Saccoglossus kowalevskii]|uniref:ATPase family AAA domain-containing protein 5-like n=1 Tax=Saccoglossus kowalevskii TaxID=10224 RepID=A0ABM0GJH7_SACKO|nr:PREDICTED: ATPase family AAA domain-containing protein 5-like [Saccoglossus kowalevskii]